MKIKYYGVRGSIPAPGPETVRYGGNTSCVAVEADNQLIICDAGSGIRKLGLELMAKEYSKGQGKAHVLISHTHWDHIQGWPFFVPAYIRGNEFDLYGEKRLGRTVQDAIDGQQEPPCFPEDAKFTATLNFHELKEWQPFEIGSAKITPARLNHPNGVFAYRIDHAGKSIVYATDTEHYSAPDLKLIKLAKDADLLIYDGQYTPEEYPQKQRWGHSTYEEGIKIAKTAGVKELHLFHHDPTHSDDTIDQIIERAQREFPRTKAAREGYELNLDYDTKTRELAAAGERK